LVACANAHLIRIVNGLAAESSESVLGASRCAVRVANHVASAVEDNSNVMPLAVVYHFTVAREDVHSADIGFVEDGSDCAVAGNAQTPGIRVSAADITHFGYDHAGVGGFEPCRDCPIAYTGVEACSGGAPSRGV